MPEVMKRKIFDSSPSTSPLEGVSDGLHWPELSRSRCLVEEDKLARPAVEAPQSFELRKKRSIDGNDSSLPALAPLCPDRNSALLQIYILPFQAEDSRRPQASCQGAHQNRL